MRSWIDRHVCALMFSSVLLGGCATTDVGKSSVEDVNQIYYADLHTLPEGTFAVVTLQDADGRVLMPELRLKAHELPVSFNWPGVIEPREAPVQLAARLELNGAVLARAERTIAVDVPLRLQLEPSDEQRSLPEVSNTRWRVLSYGGRPALDYADANISFGEAGQITGSGGCNQYNGQYQSMGNLMTIDELSVTRKICFASVMYQEHTLFKMLENVTHFEWHNKELLLFSDSVDDPVRLSSVQDL